MAVWGASGQVCTAGTRVLVQRGVYDDIMARITAPSRSLTIGSPFDPGCRSRPGRIRGAARAGRPDTSPSATTKVPNWSSVATATETTGYFFEPTIFSGVDNAMRIAREEIFGPVMSVIAFDTEEQAFAIANDTDYGLSAGVWTTDLARAHRAYRSIRAGTVWVNTYQEVNAAVPYGGVKQSGHGRTLGEESLGELLQTKSVWMKVAR